jgi:hypothetical protein
MVRIQLNSPEKPISLRLPDLEHKILVVEIVDGVVSEKPLRFFDDVNAVNRGWELPAVAGKGLDDVGNSSLQDRCGVVQKHGEIAFQKGECAEMFIISKFIS